MDGGGRAKEKTEAKERRRSLRGRRSDVFLHTNPEDNQERGIQAVLPLQMSLMERTGTRTWAELREQMLARKDAYVQYESRLEAEEHAWEDLYARFEYKAEQAEAKENVAVTSKEADAKKKEDGKKTPGPMEVLLERAKIAESARSQMNSSSLSSTIKETEKASPMQSAVILTENLIAKINSKTFEKKKIQNEGEERATEVRKLVEKKRASAYQVRAVLNEENLEDLERAFEEQLTILARYNPAEAAMLRIVRNNPISRLQEFFCCGLPFGPDTVKLDPEVQRQLFPEKDQEEEENKENLSTVF